MVESVSVLLVSIAAVLTAIDQISIVLTTKKLWRQLIDMTPFRVSFFERSDIHENYIQ